MSTPTLIVRQSNKSGWNNPFVAVFEPVKGEKHSVLQVQKYGVGGDVEGEVHGIAIQTSTNSTDFIISSTTNAFHQLEKNTELQALFGMIRERNGEIEMLYLGNGCLIRRGTYSIESVNDAYISIYKYEGVWYYSADSDFELTLAGKQMKLEKGYQRKIIE